jgi:glucose-6-phosphate isomerase
MLSKKNFFKNSSVNLKKTEEAFNVLKKDINNFDLPLLQSFSKDYALDFTPSLTKKFSKCNNIIIIGMGGSILGTKSIYSYFKNKIKKNVFFFDNLDENLYLGIRKIKDLKKSCFIIVSKSGNTIETIANFNIILSKVILKNKLVIITEAKDSALTQIANKFNADVIEYKDYIGGRYSVLSEVGMFPAALMGLNIKKFKNLNKLIKNKIFSNCLIKNVASIYALNKKSITNSVILNYNSDLHNLSEWYQQLISESLGKKGKGITPILSDCPKDHHSTLQLYLDGPKNKFYTFFSTKKSYTNYKTTNQNIPNNIRFIKNKKISYIINAQCEATKNIFRKKKIPFREFFFNKENEDELGMVFIFFVLETILLARLMKIDPFSQPAVEEIKINTRKILS